jgi:tetratricopeptide (TPR) repeat protein
VQNQHVPVPQAIERGFGITPKQFDSEIEKYYRGNSVRGLRQDIPPFETVLYSSAKLKLPDLQAVLADVHLHSADHLDKAVAEFAAILSSEPEHAASHRGLGYAYLQKGDFERAAEHFARAAALDSNDARVHYYTALLMNRRTGGRIDNPGDMAIHLKRAIQLDPTLADAYNLLAYVQVTRGSAAEALESIKAAVRLSPRNDYYNLTLGQIYMAQQKWDEAAEVFKRLEKSANPQVAASARTNLQLTADYKQNVHHVEWSELRERNQQKEWGTTPSRERLEEEATAKKTQQVAPPAPVPDTRPVKFVKGRLVNVACLANTTAILTIVPGADSPVASLTRKGAGRAPASAPGGKTVKLLVPDVKKVLVMGADAFSCEWHDQRAAVNYRAGGGDFDGEVMSLELQ